MSGARGRRGWVRTCAHYKIRTGSSASRTSTRPRSTGSVRNLTPRCGGRRYRRRPSDGRRPPRRPAARTQVPTSMTIIAYPTRLGQPCSWSIPTTVRPLFVSISSVRSVQCSHSPSATEASSSAQFRSISRRPGLNGGVMSRSSITFVSFQLVAEDRAHLFPPSVALYPSLLSAARRFDQPLASTRAIPARPTATRTRRCRCAASHTNRNRSHLRIDPAMKTPPGARSAD